MKINFNSMLVLIIYSTFLASCAAYIYPVRTDNVDWGIVDSSNVLAITFEDGFSKTDVSVYIGGEAVYSGVISTSLDGTATAGYFEVNLPSKGTIITIEINNQKLLIWFDPDYGKYLGVAYGDSVVVSQYKYYPIYD